eukprot:g5332.t1
MRRGSAKIDLTGRGKAMEAAASDGKAAGAGGGGSPSDGRGPQLRRGKYNTAGGDAAAPRRQTNGAIAGSVSVRTEADGLLESFVLELSRMPDYKTESFSKGRTLKALDLDLIFKFNPGITRVTQLIFILFVIIHVIACMYWGVAVAEKFCDWDEYGKATHALKNSDGIDSYNSAYYLSLTE